MARLGVRGGLLAPAVTFLLLLLLTAAAGAEDEKKNKKKVGMRVRVADEEEARWLDRYAETHEPLNAPGGGPLLMRPANAEEARWLNRNPNKERAAGDGDGDNVLEFDQDDPYYRAMQAWVQHLIKQKGGIKFVDNDDPDHDVQKKDVQDL